MCIYASLVCYVYVIILFVFVFRQMLIEYKAYLTMTDVIQRGLCNIQSSPAKHDRVAYCYCNTCYRMYTVFTSRKGLLGCPRCRRSFNRSYTRNQLVQRHLDMQSPPLTPKIESYLISVFNRTHIGAIRRWWADNKEEMAKASEFDIVKRCFGAVNREETPRRRRSYFHTVAYELVLAHAIPETKRCKYSLDGPIQCIKCERNTNIQMMRTCSSGHFTCVRCTQQRCHECHESTGVAYRTFRDFIHAVIDGTEEKNKKNKKKEDKDDEDGEVDEQESY